MAERTTVIKTVEQGRAKFAYECVEEGKQIKEKTQVDGEWFHDDKYASHVRKIPMLIKTNGLGATFGYILSKRKKEERDKKPGSSDNPKNAYDLIYLQATEWLKQEPKQLIANRLKNGEDLLKIIVSLNSPEYRALTNEVLAFSVWLSRFAEGLIEEESTE